MTEAAQIRIEEVGVEAVRPLRSLCLRPNKPWDAVWYRTDEEPSARHFAALDAEGNVVGIGSMHFEDRAAGQAPFGHPGMRVRGVAVEEGWRRRGLGAALVERMVEVGRGAGMVEAWSNARVTARPFYRRCGFREISADFEVPGLGVHVVVAWSLARGRRARSVAAAARAADLAGAEPAPAVGSGSDAS